MVRRHVAMDSHGDEEEDDEEEEERLYEVMQLCVRLTDESLSQRIHHLCHMVFIQCYDSSREGDEGYS